MKDIYVTKPYLPPIDKYEEYLTKIWNSGVLTNNGPLLIEFKDKLSEYIKNNNINLYCNGHNALECAIKGLNMKKGEIITTPFTFVSTTHAIVNCGYTPVFCDIKESDMTIDENKIENLITDNTVAILPVHVYGFPCNVDALEKIAKKHHLKLIYDAAHAFGVFKNNSSILNYGDISMVSFHATKLFNTIEGGMTVCSDESLSHKLALIQNFGISDYEQVTEIGGNAKMNEFCAAMGLACIDDIDLIIKKRKEITFDYLEKLEKIEGIKTFKFDDEGIKYNYAYFPIIVDKETYGMSRDKLSEKLNENGIFARKYFYPLTSDMECYNENHNFKDANVSIARSVSQNILTLPIYYDLTPQDVKRICKVIKK